MALPWVATRTWSAGEVPTAAQANQYWRDDLDLATHAEDVEATAVDVANTTTETTIFTYTVPANRMSTNRMLRLTMIGDLLYNNSDTNTVTIRLKFGGSTLISKAYDPSGLSAGRRWWEMVISLANLGAANSQVAIIALQGAALVNANDVEGATAAIDTTSDQLFEVTAQWSAASANNSWRRHYGVLELTGS